MILIEALYSSCIIPVYSLDNPYRFFYSLLRTSKLNPQFLPKRLPRVSSPARPGRRPGLLAGTLHVLLAVSRE